MKTIIKNTITCGQNDLKNMSITQNGTVAVHTAEGVALPHVMMDNVRMEMGGGEIIVSKEIKANPFCRRRTTLLHTGTADIAHIALLLDKNGTGTITIRGIFKDVTDAKAAVEEAKKTIEADMTLIGLDFQHEARLLDKSYRRDKAAYERSEEKRVAALLECEEANRAAIRAALKTLNIEH